MPNFPKFKRNRKPRRRDVPSAELLDEKFLNSPDNSEDKESLDFFLDDTKNKPFKGVEDEYLNRALTLTLPVKFDKSTSVHSHLNCSNYDRLMFLMDFVAGLLDKNARKWWFTFELTGKGGLHFHCYLKLKPDNILGYRNSLYNWERQYGFAKDKQVVSPAAGKVWKRYIHKEWEKTQLFFFGRVIRARAIRHDGESRVWSAICDTLRETSDEDRERFLEAESWTTPYKPDPDTDKSRLKTDRSIRDRRSRGNPNVFFETGYLDVQGDNKGSPSRTLSGINTLVPIECNI